MTGVSEIKLDELDLRSNPRKWIGSLIASYPHSVSKDEMDNLLSDFTEPMKTRMREESKYAIGLLMQNRLILCHSYFGEETITPKWEVIPRMLDTGNVLRYVSFLYEKGGILVKYWEKEATSSFIEWLNLPRKQAFLFGGKYKIYCEIEGITTGFELTENEMEKWLETHSELKLGTIKFAFPIQYLNVREIRAGRKRYDNTEEFIQDYEADKYGILDYQTQYERITKGSLPLLMKYYDEQTRVVRIEGEEEVVEVSKNTPGFDIIFVNERIDFRMGYLADITKRFINNEQIRLVHVGVKFKTPPAQLGSLSIYNNLIVDSLAQQLINYHNATNLQDNNLNILFKCGVLKILANNNAKSPIWYVLENIFARALNVISLSKQWSKVEDKILEYKPGDVLSGKYEHIISELSADLSEKLKYSPCKIYCIGIEDSGNLNPIPSNRLKSDRIDAITRGLKEALATESIYAFPVVQGDKGILVVIVQKP